MSRGAGRRHLSRALAIGRAVWIAVVLRHLIFADSLEGLPWLADC